MTLSRQESKNFLLGEGFPLSIGANDSGEVRISAIRFFQDWTVRNPREVFAIRSQFSLGIDAFDSTTKAFEPLNDNDFEAQADQLAAELAEYTGFNSPILSDYTVSREGIYEEHP